MAGLTGRERGLLAGVGALTATTAALQFAGARDVAVFLVAAGALAGLAWVVSFATEAVGEQFGPALTGVLQSTLGNLPELFVVLFAISAGELVVAQYSVLGSIFANALLVLGLVLMAGARKGGGIMRFNRGLANDTATLLLLAVFIIALLGLSNSVGDRASRHQIAISAIGAVVLLAVYVVWLVSYLRAGRQPPLRHAPRVPLRLAIGLLAVSGVAAAFVSDWFVGAIDEAVKALGISKEFTGLVIVGIAGNAVENVVGVQLAMRNRPDFAISVILNSALQVALALTPVLVFASLFFETHLTLVFPVLLALVLVIAGILGALIVDDGASTWEEGVVLVGFYVVIAASFWWGT